MKMIGRLTLLCLLLGVTASQMPTYLSTKYAFPSSSGMSSATLQSLLARQLYAPSSPASTAKRPLSTASVPTARYGLPSASNPSIVAIPLYVRNQQAAAKNRAIYELLANGDKKSSASNKYLSYLPKKSSLEPYRSESTKYERPLFPSYPKYDSPKASSSQYEPVRSYELKQSEPGFGDASSVSLLSSGYGGSSGSGSISVAYPPPSSSYKQSSSSQQPRLKAVEYDDSQKSALADFASALENFELKQITNQDIYDLPAINPPLSRVPAKQESRGEDSYGASSGYGKSQSYEAPVPKQSYSGASSSDDSQSPYGQTGSQSYSGPEYAASSDSYRPSSESYRPSSDSYRVSSSDSYRQKESYRQPERVVTSYSERIPSSSYSDRSPSYSERSPSYSERGVSSGDSYRAASTSDSYGSSSALYVPAPSSYADSSPATETSYSVRPSDSSSGDEYSYAQSAPLPNPDDPNCPYKVHSSGTVEAAAASSDYSESPASVVPAPTTSSYLSSSKLNAYKQALAAQQGYGTDGAQLDPSKLELKIVHLPVSVLKRLVGNGELALPSFNKKK